MQAHHQGGAMKHSQASMPKSVEVSFEHPCMDHDSEFWALDDSGEWLHTSLCLGNRYGLQLRSTVLKLGWQHCFPTCHAALRCLPLVARSMSMVRDVLIICLLTCMNLSTSIWCSQWRARGRVWRGSCYLSDNKVWGYARCRLKCWCHFHNAWWYSGHHSPHSDTAAQCALTQVTLTRWHESFTSPFSIFSLR